MITLFGDNKEIPVEWVEFSDGALTCKVDTDVKEVKGTLHFNVCPTTPCKQVSEEINLLINSLVSFSGVEELPKLELHLHYLPYARADRVFLEGNPNALESFLTGVQLFFEKIHLYDVHNIQAVNDNIWSGEVVHTDQTSCFQYTCKRHDGYAQKWDYVISPDKGATEKANKIGKVLSIPVIQASKKRNLNTGRIESVELSTDNLPTEGRVIIVDDILDGGGTFIPLADKLRSQGFTVDLYVTHLIAAKGLDLFKGMIDNIYCYQTVGKYINRTDVMNFNLGK